MSSTTELLPPVEVWSATPTPFTSDVRVDPPSIHRMVDHHLTIGVSGLMLAGTSGEGPWMRKIDVETLIQTTVEAAAGRLRIAVQVTDNSVARVLDNDLSLESYLLKGGFGSVGVFKKDIRGFFVTTASSATPELLETYGSPTTGEYLNYMVSTRGNGGDASITGVEFAYKQALTFLPARARGVQVFVNLTKLSLGGSSQSDFTGFDLKTLSWGASLTRGRLALKLTSSEQGETRRSRRARR